MKKVNKDPFSNGTDFSVFEHYNCNKCIKSSQPKEDGTFTNADKNNMPNKCSIQRDIVIRMFSNEPIKQKTIDICENFTLKGVLCPYIKTERKKVMKKRKDMLEFEF